MPKPGPGRLPRFATEEEELRFWDEHHPADWIEGPAEVIVRPKQPPKKVVTIRLDEALYDDLKAAAALHGVTYQRLMRELVRLGLDGLKRERQTAGPPSGRETAPAGR